MRQIENKIQQPHGITVIVPASQSRVMQTVSHASRHKAVVEWEFFQHIQVTYATI